MKIFVFNRKNAFLKQVISFVIFATFFAKSAWSTDPCSVQQVLNSILNNDELRTQKIDNLDELLKAFTEGLEPNLANPSQRDAFELYRRMKFGNPDTSLSQSGSKTALDVIADEVKKYPKLEKEPFRNMILSVEKRSYPVTKELSQFLDPQIASAGQIRSNLFQVEANSGYWKKIFQYKDSLELKPFTQNKSLIQNLSTEEKIALRENAKRLKEEQRVKFTSFLDIKISPEFRAELLNQSLSPFDRGKKLYEILRRERGEMIRVNKDIRPISQAMVDLVQAGRSPKLYRLSLGEDS